MNKQALSGVLWRVYNDIFWLQKHGILPTYPWDIMSFDEEKLVGHDEGFGGNWLIMEQNFIFQWDILPNTISITPIVPSTTLTLLMRGELPVGSNNKPLESKEAQRRWFMGKMRREKPSGKLVGNIQEMLVLEVESRDDVINILKNNVV